MVYKHALIIHSCQFCLTLVRIVSNMPERPSPVNDPATAQQILQPLPGSGEQVALPTTSSSQAGLTSGTTASGDNASQSSSQENATGSNVSNNPTMTLEVFSFEVLLLYSSRSLLVIFCCCCCSTLHFLIYVFSVTREPVFSLCAWSTWSVIYSVGLAMLRFILVLGDNLLFCIMFRCYARLFFFFCCFLLNLGCYIPWELFFVFSLASWGSKKLFMLFAHFFSCLSLERTVGRDASVKVRCVLTVVFGFGYVAS